MTSFATLKCTDTPLCITVLHLENGNEKAIGNGNRTAGLELSGLLTPLRLLEQQLGARKLSVTLQRVTLPVDVGSLAPVGKNIHLALLVGEAGASPDNEQIRKLAHYCGQARFWGGVGSAVLWLACAGKLAHIRAALPWALYAEINEVGEQAILVPNLFELDGRVLTCCGGTASIDFALTLIHALFGADLQAQVMESLCVDRVRNGDERQRIALHTRFGVLQPQLSEAVTLMENNIEETLSTDDIAQLVGLSRRQLERQFKQYLGTMPSRYYLELRLKKARALLLESNSSIVQIGLMCGFSSGAHFSTAFGAQFGITPREERQRKLVGVGGTASN